MVIRSIWKPALTVRSGKRLRCLLLVCLSGVPIFMSLVFWSLAQAQNSLVAICGQRCAAQCSPDVSRGERQAWAIGCLKRCQSALRQCVIYPKYFVLGLLYVPPGCTSTATLKCSSASSVDYLSGSSVGTRTSVQASFKEGTSVSIGADYSVDKIVGFGMNDSSGFSSSVTDTTATTVSKSQSFDMKIPANGDGIDHGQDQFLLLLNPAVQIDSLGNMSEWSFGYVKPSPTTYTLYVSWLQNPSTMPGNVANELRGRGFTDADFKAILALDPFADGSTAIDPKRFARTTWTFPYEPAREAANCNGGVCTCTSFARTIKNDFETDDVYQFQTQLSTNSTMSGSFLDLNLKSGDSTDWTFTSSVTNIRSSTNSASVTVVCPSPTYNGPTLMAVYWDTLFGSFMFAPNSNSSLKLI